MKGLPTPFRSVLAEASSRRAPQGAAPGAAAACRVFASGWCGGAARTTLIVAVLVAASGPIYAQPTPSDDVALPPQADPWDSFGGTPWYDPARGELTPIPLAQEPPLRQASDWTWNPQPQRTSQSWNWGDWSAFWDLMQVLAWIGIAGLFAMLIYFWLSTYARQQLAAARGSDDASDDWTEQARLEQLPFPVARTQTDLLGEARRLYQIGDYRQALIYLFSYQLVQLDKHQQIRLTKGKTNRQYLYEVSSSQRMRHLLLTTMLAFEDAYFGHYTVDRARFETCWQGLEEFEALLQGNVREVAGRARNGT